MVSVPNGMPFNQQMALGEAARAQGQGSDSRASALPSDLSAAAKRAGLTAGRMRQPQGRHRQPRLADEVAPIGANAGLAEATPAAVERPAVQDAVLRPSHVPAREAPT